MTLSLIGSGAPAMDGSVASAARASASTTPNRVISAEVTHIMPPGYTQTTTTKADGVITTMTTNSAGALVQTTIATATMPSPEPTAMAVSLWA